jgi:hypothetical protein
VRAIAAKNISDHMADVVKYDIAIGEPLSIKEGIFCMKFQLVEIESPIVDIYLDDLGYWSNDNEDNMFAIRHEHWTDRTYNWFIPANIGTVDDFKDSGMSRGRAHETLKKYARNNYEWYIGYGLSWALYELHVSCTIDLPGFEDLIFLGEEVEADEIFSVESYPSDVPDELHVAIDHMRKKMKMLALDRLIIMQKSLSDVVVTDKRKGELLVESMYQKLQDYGATFLVMLKEKEVDLACIRDWANHTDADEFKESCGFELGQVWKRAGELADYIQSRR